MNEYYPYKKKPSRFNNPIDVMMHFHTKGIGHGFHWDREKVMLSPAFFEIVKSISDLTEIRRELMNKRMVFKSRRNNFGDYNYAFPHLTDEELLVRDDVLEGWKEITKELLVNEDDIADFDILLKEKKKRLKTHPEKNLRLHTTRDEIYDGLDVFDFTKYIDISETEGFLL